MNKTLLTLTLVAVLMATFASATSNQSINFPIEYEVSGAEYTGSVAITTHF